MKNMIVTMALITMLASGITLAADFSTLEQVKKTKKIRIGYRADKPPMSFVDRNNELVGYSIDLCLRMVDELKTTLEMPDIKIEYVPVNASNRFGWTPLLVAVRYGQVEIVDRLIELGADVSATNRFAFGTRLEDCSLNFSWVASLLKFFGGS